MRRSVNGIHYTPLSLARNVLRRIPVEELIPVGPLTVKVKLPEGVSGKRLQSLVSGVTATPVSRHGEWGQFEIKSILDHEVIVLE